MERDDIQPVQRRVRFIYVTKDQTEVLGLPDCTPIYVTPSSDLDHQVPGRVGSSQPQGTVVFNVSAPPEHCVPVADNRYAPRDGRAFRVKGSNKVYVVPNRNRKLDA